MDAHPAPPSGVGVDLLHASRVRRILAGPHRDTFLRRAFTARELAESSDGRDHDRSLAMRFAAKEAVFKALETTWCDEDELCHLEVILPAGAKPRVELHGRFRQLAAVRGIAQVALSVAEDADLIVAVAVTGGGVVDRAALSQALGAGVPARDAPARDAPVCDAPARDAPFRDAPASEAREPAGPVPGG